MGTGGLELWGVGIGPGARLAGAATISGIFGFGWRLRQRDRARETAAETRARSCARLSGTGLYLTTQRAERGASLTERALAMATPGTNLSYTRVKLSFLVRISEISNQVATCKVSRVIIYLLAGRRRYRCWDYYLLSSSSSATGFSLAALYLQGDLNDHPDGQ